MRPGRDGDHNDRSAIYGLRSYIWYDLWAAGVGDGIGDTVHQWEKDIFIDTDHGPRLVIHADDQLPTLGVGKGDDRLDISFAVFWQSCLELHIFGLSLDDRIDRHHSYLLTLI